MSVEKNYKKSIREVYIKAINEDQKNLKKWYIDYLSRAGQELDFKSIREFQYEDIIEFKKIFEEINNKLRIGEFKSKRDQTTMQNQQKRLKDKLEKLEKN